jgi:hypothetical protein
MASLATTPRRVGMVEARAVKSGRVEVTGFARCVGHNVSAGFRCGHDTFAQCVTAVAGARCTLEYAADMTSFAGHDGMTALQHEAGGHVIEVTSALLGFCRSALQREHCQCNGNQAAQNSSQSFHVEPPSIFYSHNLCGCHSLLAHSRAIACFHAFGRDNHAHLDLLPIIAIVTAITTIPVITVMHVVPVVTAAACSGSHHLFVHRLGVARITFMRRFLVRPVQLKLGLIVVKIPRFPVTRVVANLTFSTQFLLVDIFFLVTRPTF